MHQQQQTLTSLQTKKNTTLEAVGASLCNQYSRNQISLFIDPCATINNFTKSVKLIRQIGKSCWQQSHSKWAVDDSNHQTPRPFYQKGLVDQTIRAASWFCWHWEAMGTLMISVRVSDSHWWFHRWIFISRSTCFGSCHSVGFDTSQKILLDSLQQPPTLPSIQNHKS